MGVSGQEIRLNYEPLIEENVVEFAEEIRLRNANLRKYHIGDKFHFTLSFGLMDKSQRDDLYEVYKTHRELHFQPLPDSEPAVHYKVRWVNGFNIKYHAGIYLTGYEGEIELDQI